MYFLIVAELTSPAVDTKKLLVHSEGAFDSVENSVLIVFDVIPFIWCIMMDGVSVGAAEMNRCTWS